MKDGPNCHRCPLREAPGPVWGNGPLSAKLVVIGQCPGPDEVSSGRPFSGGSGTILERSLAKAGVSRSGVFVTNVVKCFVPPKTQVPRGAAECCRPLLDRELDSIQYNTILTLGQEAFYEFSGKKMVTLSPPRSQKKPPDPNVWLRGCVYRVGLSRQIIPAAHPAFVASGGFRDAPFFDADVSKAVRFSKGGGVHLVEHYDYKPNSRQVLEYVDEIIATGDFGLDFETPEKSAVEEEEELLGSGPTDIQVAGLSHAPGWCLGVPGDMLSLLKPLFTGKHPRRLLCRVFNWGFEGYHLVRTYGPLSVVGIDLMLQLNRCYSDSKRKDLGTALSLFTDMPYTKNLAKSDPDRYNACDTYGTLDGSRTAQQYMEGMRMWDDFIKEDVPLWNIIIDMKVTGTRCDVNTAHKLEYKMIKALEAYETWWKSKLGSVDWQSPKQLLALFAAMHLPIVMRKRAKKDKNGHKSFTSTPSCDEEVLEMYVNKHQNKIAGLVLTMRGLKKASDFTRIHSSDGWAHPTYKIHGQVAGRIQSKDPNFENIPEELGGIHPRTILVPDDPDKDCIISADFEAIEFFVYGYAANDVPILEARKSGTYIYGVFYESIFHKPFFEPGRPPKKAYKLKGIPPWELLVAKSGPLGMLYGRGAKSLEDGFGISKSNANQIHKDFFTRHWAVAAHHQDLMGEAQRNGYLRNYFNRIRRFPNAYGMRNEILAYTGQSNAVDILITRALLPIAAGIKDFGGRLLFPVHDSVQISCPRRALSGAVQFVRDCMEAPIPEMNGFWIPCVIKVGTKETSTTGNPNWGDTKTWEDWVISHGYKHAGAAGYVQDVSRG